MTTQSYTQADLQALKGPALLALYNERASATGAKPVKKFADHKTAVRRTLELFSAAGVAKKADGEPKPEAAPAPAAKKNGAAKKDGGERKKRGMYFVFPVESTIKEPKKGSNRHKLMEYLLVGHTFDFCNGHINWGKKKPLTPEKQEKATYEGIRLLHYYSGYGLRQEGDAGPGKPGKIFLVTEKPKR